MITRKVRLVDQTQLVLATGEVADEGDHFGGTIDLCSTPNELRLLFEEFEEIVNGQMFSFLDEIQEKIEAFRLKALFEDGWEVDITDLQVFPSTGDVSFRLVCAIPHATT
jgi:hypothetical protein